MSLTVFSVWKLAENTALSEALPKLTSFEHFYYKKAAVVLNLSLIGKICHNFLVPRMIELVWKTFMSIHTLVLHRVSLAHICSLFECNSTFWIQKQEMST